MLDNEVSGGWLVPKHKALNCKQLFPVLFAVAESMLGAVSVSCR